jgi:inhibitor of the pro-sigma K processing machinery
VDSNLLLAYGFGLLLLYLIARVLFLPLKVLWLLVGNGLAGGLTLWAANLAGAYFGFHLGFNPVSALVVGFFGLPGLALLVALRLWAS